MSATAVAGVGAPPRPASPYKGLAAFDDTELDELLFFGREREREVIASNLIAARITVLFGPSGVGKSSVLRAAVARDLRAQAERPLVVVHDAWSGDAHVSLADAFAAAAGVDAAGLPDAAELAAAGHGTVYLILDQLETYFVHHGADRALGNALVELLERPELPVHVLLSIREDALARLDVFKTQVPGLLENRLRLEPLDRDAGRRAILGPIERFDALVPEEEALAIEPALVEAVLDGVRAGALVHAGRGRGVDRAAVSRARIETPYLQLVMQRLWEVERAEGSRVLRLSTLERLGGPLRMVEEHLERALATLTPGEKELAAQVFNHLVTPSGMKVSHRAADLAGYVGATDSELAPVLDGLERERILRPVGTEAGDVSHEIFHDVLADAVLAWRARFEADQMLERERAAARRRHRRLAVVAAGALVALAAMAAVAIFALSQRSDARRSAAEARLQRASAVRHERDARQQRALALGALAEARLQARRAARQASIADEQRARAERQTALAGAQRARAVQQTALANEQRARAEQQTRIARRETGNAIRQSRFARAQRHIAEQQRAKAIRASAAAESARVDAQRQASLAAQRARQAAAAQAKAESAATQATARELAYNSLALLPSDPEQSLALAVRATETDPALAIDESTLRDALLATRGLHVLDGGARASALRAPASATVSPLHDAEFSPDGSLVVTAGDAGSGLFRAATGAELGRLPVHGSVSTAAFAPDGRTVATAGADGRTMLWDVASRRLVRTLRQSGVVRAAIFSPDGALVATLGSDRSARLWNASTGGLVAELPHPLAVLGGKFSPDGTRLVTYTNDRFARVWDTATGKLLLSLEHGASVTDARFSPHADVIATASRDGLARLWNAADGSLMHELQTNDNVRSAVFSPDGEVLVTVGSDGDGRVWDVATGWLETLLAGHRTAIRSAAFSPDGHYIVTAGTDGSARIWSYPDGNEQARLLGHDGAVAQASFSPSGTTVLTASADGSARIWDARIDRQLTLLGRHRGAVNGIAYSPDGATLASAGADGSVQVWSIARRQLVRRLDAGAPLADVAFSPDGRLVAAVGTAGGVHVWNLASGALVSGPTHGPALHAVAFSPDGTRLGTAGADGIARLAPLRGGAPLLLAHPAAVTDIAFSPAGDTVATACADGLARLWDAGTGKPSRTFKGHSDDVTSVAFSPDGRLLVTASRDHDVRTWSLATGATVRLLHGHAALVSDAAFSSDGRWIVSAGPMKAGVWAVSADDLPDDRLFFLIGHSGPLSAAAFAPHGWLIATGGADGTVRTNDCSLCGKTPQLLTLARARLAQLGRR